MDLQSVERWLPMIVEVSSDFHKEANASIFFGWKLWFVPNTYSQRYNSSNHIMYSRLLACICNQLRDRGGF